MTVRPDVCLWPGAAIAHTRRKLTLEKSEILRPTAYGLNGEFTLSARSGRTAMVQEADVQVSVWCIVVADEPTIHVGGQNCSPSPSPHGRTRMIVFPGRRSVGLNAATAL